jgi:LacI family transcriptional regulator, sucrose operon repressor
MYKLGEGHYLSHMVTVPQKRLTIRDIATLSGVSTSTVSRVLNNSGYVKAEVRERISAVISQTHYTPSEPAKQLKSHRSGLIGVIIPKINSYTTGEIVSGISSVLEPLRCQMLLANTDNSVAEEEAAYDLFRRQRVAGVLHLATTVNGGLINAIREAGLPIVMIGQDASHLGVTSVVQNERSAARQITEHLLGCGHTRIGLVTVGEEDHQVGGERTAGYVEALQARGLPVDPALIVRASFRAEAGEEAAERLLRATGEARCTAILAVTDRLAVGVMACLHDRGMRVPDDMAVAGMGDSDMARMVRPALSTVHYDYGDTGAQAARLMLEMSEAKGGKASRVVMPYRLALRRST